MLSLLGFAAIAIFMILVLTNRLSAIVALIAVPVFFGAVAGFAPQLGDMMMNGVTEVAPTALMLVFALLYFAVMIEAGLFEPFVNKVIEIAGSDPVRICVGSAILIVTLMLDGDGSTTALISISALYPVYRRIGLNPLIIALLLGMSGGIMNWVPWGGPAARAAVSLRVDVADIVVPMLPAMGLSILFIIGIAYFLGLSERRRLAKAGPVVIVADDHVAKSYTPKSTRNFWFNLILTLALVVSLALQIAPLAATIMVAFAVAVTVNFPRLSEQRERLAIYGSSVMMVVSLIFAASAFTGILSGTGMIAGMTDSILSVLPEEWGGYFGPIVGLLSVPLLVVLSTDAFYLGVLPVLSATGAAHGVPPEVIARAALVGMPAHGLSPLIAPIYLVASLLRVEIGALQRFAWPFLILLSLFALFAAMITGAVYVVP
jgi:CitMHS family citrate-Mg2+:H+ or citrate-Ca2+:H+ symporter